MGDVQLKEIGTLEDVCPYCSALLKKRPQRKAKCRDCGHFILVRTRPADRKRVLVTEHQAEEIEAQWAEIHSVPPCRISWKEGFNEEKQRLTTKFGHEPSDNDVTWSLLNKELLDHSAKQHWGLYRNALFEMGEVLRAESKLVEALSRYLEVCYLDLNGPKNQGPIDESERKLLREMFGEDIRPFKSEDGELYPGMLYYAEYVIRKLGLQSDAVRDRFLSAAATLQKALGLPVSAEAAWTRLKNELFPS